MTSTWSERRQSRWSRWLDRRIPRAASVTLDQRRIFIFPSRTGFFFGLSLLVMLIAAINYQNNMSFALTFLLANLFVIAVLHTYANLSGLTITALGADDAFPDQRTAFRLRLTASGRRGHYALLVGWPVASATRKGFGLRRLLRSPEMQASLELDLQPETQHDFRLHVSVGGRGWYRPGRLRIESVYPLGLLRCWTWVDLDVRALVYPAPVAGSEPGSTVPHTQAGVTVGGLGDEDFSGIRDYRPGDSPRQVYWKGVARGQELQSKEYAATVSDTRWLTWEQFSGLGLERRLSLMCYWVLEYHRREIDYGLRLPGTELPVARGDRQRDLALRALALYGLHGELVE